MINILWEVSMELKFVINDYVLIWTLLFQPTSSVSLNKLKQKLWRDYKEDYNDAYNDKILIYKDYKNFIPSNDNIYNIILEQKYYEKLKLDTDKYRKELLKVWDMYKRKINEILKKTLRTNILPYDIFIVNKDLNIIDSTIPNNKTRGNILIGRNDKNNLNLLLNIILFILRKEIPIESANDNITKAIVELLVLNEIPTKLTHKSTQISGNPSLTDLKREIYPYWLMYLGVKEEELNKYMLRDKISFDISKYKYNSKLQRMNIFEFINYIKKNYIEEI